MAEVEATSDPPDWNSFTLDLFCPRCDYNVRMLTGSRCPECGLDLEWPRIVAAAEQRGGNPTFEYRWRDRPVRSFFYTIRICVQPRRLWKSLSIADSPRGGPLAIFTLLTCGLYVTATVSAYVVGLAFLLMSRGRGATAIWNAIPNYLPDFFSIVIPDLAVYASIAALLWLFLQIFQQTISRCRVRNPQLIRVIVFTFAAFLCLKCLKAIPIIYLYAYAPPKWFSPLLSYIAIDYSAVGMCVVSLGYGLSSYLQIQRGWQIAICISVLTLLTCLTALVVISIACGTWGNPLARAVGRAWPGLGDSLWRLLN